jgi:hypothetical protein
MNERSERSEIMKLTQRLKDNVMHIQYAIHVKIDFRQSLRSPIAPSKNKIPLAKPIQKRGEEKRIIM